jgi:hypothetical protein
MSPERTLAMDGDPSRLRKKLDDLLREAAESP